MMDFDDYLMEEKNMTPDQVREIADKQDRKESNEFNELYLEYCNYLQDIEDNEITKEYFLLDKAIEYIYDEESGVRLSSRMEVKRLWEIVFHEKIKVAW